MKECNVNYAEHSPKRLFGHFSADSEMHQSFETPAPPHSGLSGAFTFYASESEWSPRFPRTKVRGAFPRLPLLSIHGTTFVKQLIIAKRNTVGSHEINMQIDHWAASK